MRRINLDVDFSYVTAVNYKSSSCSITAHTVLVTYYVTRVASSWMRSHRTYSITYMRT